MIIRRLTANDYDQLLYVLNQAFGRAYGREMDFTLELPRMWVRDDEYMGKHIGVFEEGKLCSVMGIYPLPAKIAGISLDFVTTGNVATLPGYEGKGYFTKLFSLAMEEVDRCGYDVARLTGLRQRYAKYGFEPCGSLYKFTFTGPNRKRYFGTSYQNIQIEELTEHDTDLLSFSRELANSKPFFIERFGNDNERDVYRAMRGKNSFAYIAKREGTPIGYICANNNGENITEIRAHNATDFMEMVCAWQAQLRRTVTVPVAPYMPEEFSAISACAQDFVLTSPSRFKVIHWEKLCNALIKLALSNEKLPHGEFVLRIEDYGTLRFFVTENEAGCELTDDCRFDLSLPKNKASALLFGPFRPSVSFPDHPELNAWFPLPLSWDVLDYV